MNKLLSNSPIASTVSTAGVGHAFENKIQAYYLLMLILRTPVSDRLGSVVRLQFQGRYEGIETDDLICTHVASDRVTRVFMQCKLTVSLTESDAAFGGALRKAWSDFTAASADPEHSFNVETDRLAPVYDAACTSPKLRAARRLIQIAKNSINASDFSRKCRSREYREIVRILSAIVQPGRDVDDHAKLLWAFLTSIALDPSSLGAEKSEELDKVMGAISDRMGDPSSSYMIWPTLVATAASLNGHGATVDASNLERLIDPPVLRLLKYNDQQVGAGRGLSNFLWGAEFWAVQALKGHAAQGRKWSVLTSDELLLYQRALRTANWLARDLALPSFEMVSTPRLSAI